MQRFGAFQTRDRVRSSAITSIYVCEPIQGQSADYAVKSLNAPPGCEQTSERVQASAWMLESAWAQQEAAMLPGECWAPVHDLGQQDHIAYVVSDRFDYSLDDLIRPGRKIDPNLLRHLFLKVVVGLDEAERHLHRAHANLKPSNVLFNTSSSADGLPTRVCLCDPAPASELRRRTNAAQDRQDLGRLIAAVVTGKPTLEVGTWPVPHDPAWARLGIVGEGWRSLASDLLNPAIESGPMPWEEVLRRIELLIPPVIKPKRWPWAAAAAVVLIAAGLTTFLLYPRNLTPPATFDELVVLAQEYNDWAGTTQAQLRDTSGNNETLTSYVNSKPELAAAFDGRLRGDESLPLQPKPLLGQDDRFFRDLLQTVNRLENNDPEAQLAADQTIAFLENDQAAARRAKQALDAVLATKQALEDYIDDAETDITQSASDDSDSSTIIIQQYADYARGGLTDERRSVLPAIQSLDQASTSLKQLQSNLKAFEQSPYRDDPFLAAMIEQIETERAGIALQSAQSIEPDDQSLKQLAAQSQAMRKAVTALADDTFLHYDSFIKQNQASYEAARNNITTELMQSWQTAVLTPGDAHVPPDAKDPRVDWKVQARVATAEKQIAELIELEDTENADQCSQLLRSARARIRAATEQNDTPLYWITGNVATVKQNKRDADALIDQLASRLEADLTNARRDWATEVALLQNAGPEQMFNPAEEVAHYFTATKDHRFSKSDALAQGWGKLRQQAIDVTSEKKAAIGLQREIRAAAQQLLAIDRGLTISAFTQAFGDESSPAGWDRDQTYDRFWQIREEAIEQLIDTQVSQNRTDPPASSPAETGVTQQIANAQQAITDWLANAHQTVTAYRDADRFFNLFYRPTDPLPAAADRPPTTLAEYCVSIQTIATERGIREDFQTVDARFDQLIQLYRSDLLSEQGQNDLLARLNAQPDDDLNALLRQTTADDQQTDAVRAAAFLARLRLHESANASQLRSLLDLQPAYEQIITKNAEQLVQNRIGPINQRFGIEASTAWQRSLNQTTGWEELTALADLYLSHIDPQATASWSPASEMLGLATNQLSSLSKANLYLNHYKNAIINLRADPRDPEEEDKDAHILAKNLITDLSAYQDDHPQIQTLSQRLAQAVEQHETGKHQLMSDKVGPESAWLKDLGVIVKLLDAKPGELQEVRKYEFAYRGRKQVIAFRLVQPAEMNLDPNAPPAYLSTSEVPAQFLIDILNASNRNKTFSGIARLNIQSISPVWEANIDNDEILPRDWEDVPDPNLRKAPWVTVHPGSSDFRNRAAAADINEPITKQHPMQGINASAAQYFARLLGCRLPTYNEWLAAHKAGPNPQVKPNVRDKTWERQQQHLIELNASFPIAEDIWTSRNTYTDIDNMFGREIKPSKGTQALPGNNADAAYDDGYAWPRAVNPDSAQFEDLVGNVAEWVLMNSEEAGSSGTLELPEQAPTPDEIKAFFKARWDAKEVAIVGNSAISCSRLCKPEQAVHPNEHQLSTTAVKFGGHSDVGFRLAFTVGQPRLTITVAALLDNQVFLRPAEP